MQNMIVRRMNTQDVAAVYDISCQCFSKSWSQEAIAKEMTNPQAIYYVAIDEDHIIGYGGIWHMADEGEVINIAVSKAYRGQQVGSKLLAVLIDEAKRYDLRSLFLEVRESNKAAQLLYHKFDFAEIGRRKNYYQNPKEDAINMVCLLAEEKF